MTTRQRYDHFLSIYLSARGFAFVLSEGSANLLDWGFPEARGPRKNDHCLHGVQGLARRYLPDVLILEDMKHPSSHRSLRVQKLNAAICVFAQEYGIPVVSVSREEIRNAFHPAGAETKDEIVEIIEGRFPFLASYVPPVRMPWMNADARMALFDAVAQLLTVTSRTS
jgi:hypothetical protein